MGASYRMPNSAACGSMTALTSCRVAEREKERCSRSMALISWVQSYMVCGDIREAARYTVLASASADAENRTEVEESCLDTVLAA